MKELTVKIIYSIEAVDDLYRLRKFIEEKNPAAASRIAQGLIDRIENLSLFPEMGHVVLQAPEPEEVRDMVFGTHVVRYTYRRGIVVVLRVWHQLEMR
jgi:plasmid stabilization system protein ParE